MLRFSTWCAQVHPSRCSSYELPKKPTSNRPSAWPRDRLSHRPLRAGGVARTGRSGTARAGRGAAPSAGGSGGPCGADSSRRWDPGRRGLERGAGDDGLHPAGAVRRAAGVGAHRGAHGVRRRGHLHRGLGFRRGPGGDHPRGQDPGHGGLRGRPHPARVRYLPRLPERVRVRDDAGRHRVRRTGRQRRPRRRLLPRGRLQHPAAHAVRRRWRLQQELGRFLERSDEPRRRGLVRGVPDSLQHAPLRDRPDLGLQRLPPDPAPERGVLLVRGPA